MRSPQKMKQTLQMIAEAKDANKEKIPIPVAAEALNKAFGQPVKEREPLMKEVLPLPLEIPETLGSRMIS